MFCELTVFDIYDLPQQNRNSGGGGAGTVDAARRSFPSGAF